MIDSGQPLREGVEHGLRDHLDNTWWQNYVEGSLDTALWSAIDELGLPRLLAGAHPDTSLEEAHGALQALAHLSVPAPAAETMMAHWLASKAGLELPDGPIAFGPTRAEPEPTAVKTRSGWTLTGRVHGVPWGGSASAVLLQAATEEGDVWCVLPHGHPGNESHSSSCGEPRDVLNVHGLSLPDDAVAQTPDAALMWHTGAAMRSVQMASALAHSLEYCVAYATERVQFGRPLAKFQAIQQQLAVLASLSTQASVAARRAFVALDGADVQFAVAAAKTSVGQAASQGVSIAHQSHGAMGFTAEYGLHRLTRRIWTWREEFGNEAWWSRRLGQIVAHNGADQLWKSMVAEP
jgi:acyl-CoA dehydrogenase